MQTTQISVVPSTIVKQYQVGSVVIAVASLTLFKSVTVSVTLFDATRTYIDNQQFVISGADYQAWGSNDLYIQTYVMNKLGLAIQEPAAPSSENSPP